MGNITKGEIHKHYSIGDKLGEGSFAIVKRAVKKETGGLFAVKVIKKIKIEKG